MRGSRDTLDTDVGELVAQGHTAEARALETLAGVPLLNCVPLETLRRLAFEVPIAAGRLLIAWSAKARSRCL